mmetsp:Transcript_43270/g.128182  ORF Transcript_43270/g.128182 Transcript_43270/m.128182 type:complete len:339 (+) Transcript_43270:81-1097(+)
METPSGTADYASVTSDQLDDLSATGLSASDSEGTEAKVQIVLAEFFTVRPSEIQIQRRLGSGGHADVYEAVWSRKFLVSMSSITVAVKRLKSDLGPVYRDREALAILTDHPNIVKCFDCTVDQPYLIVNEYCSGGSLFDLLYNFKGGLELTVRQRIKILVDVAEGMRYLHEQDPSILHRDLKSSNVLLTKPIRSREQEPFAKVADFGQARLSSAATRMTVGVGTTRWMAPEVFDEDDDSAGQYCDSADVYSFAMLMYETLAGKIPYVETFPDNLDPRIGLHISMGMRPETASLTDKGIPQVVLEYMQRSWDPEPKERPTFRELAEKLLEACCYLPRQS